MAVCQFDISDIQNLEVQPILLKQEIGEGILYPTEDNHVQLDDGETFRLFCQKEFDLTETDEVHPRMLHGKCVKNSIEIHETASNDHLIEIHVLELKCKVGNIHGFRRLEKNCASDAGVVLHIGFEIVEEEFAKVYMACYNEELEQAIYVRHTMTRGKVIGQSFNRDDLTFVDQRALDLNFFFNFNNQLLEDGMYYERGVVASGRLWSKGHMLTGNFPPYSYERASTFDYFNVRAQRLKANTINWNAGEQSMKILPLHYFDDFEIITIGHGTVMANLAEDLLTPPEIVYMIPDEKKVEVPMYFIAIVVRQSAAKEAVAVITLNLDQNEDVLPFLPGGRRAKPYSNPEALIFCPDVTNQLHWLKIPHRREIHKGYTWTCRIEDVFPHIDYLREDLEEILNQETVGLFEGSELLSSQEPIEKPRKPKQRPRSPFTESRILNDEVARNQDIGRKSVVTSTRVVRRSASMQY